MRTSHVFLSAAASLLALSVSAPSLAKDAAAEVTADENVANTEKAEIGAWGIDLSARDMSVTPGADFFRHVNGHWLDTVEIPEDRSRYGSFDILRERSDDQVHAILDDLAARGDGADALDQKVGAFYAAWMNEAAIEKLGTKPLEPYLAKIKAVSDRAGLLKLFGTVGYASPVGVGTLPDPANPTRYIVAAGQDGLGMPSRDYYLKEGAEYDKFRAAYRDYLIKIQKLAGISDAAAKTDRIIALETALAKSQWEPERQRDIKQIYNPMNREQLMELAPEFDWTSWLEASGFGKVDTIIAAETTAITASGKLLETVPVSTWKDYLTAHFISDNAAYLPKAFDEAKFDFFSKTLRDIPVQKDRWKRGVDLVNSNMGEAIGQKYVDRHYPAESQRQMTELVNNLTAALGERIRKSDWMDAATRGEAQKKLDAFEPRIGYPSKWIDYSPLVVKPDDVLGNVQRAAKFAFDVDLARLPHPVDRELWEMNPQTVNAYYNPLLNQITFPAAILQPPFFDPNADPAVNYGAIGGVIGHEIGHGFDDQGRQFDGSGKLRDWWTKESAEKFEARTKLLKEAYDKFEPVPGVHVNGQLTMGENIGDLGGLEMAYSAYRRYVASHGEQPVIDGLTGDQRFFLSWAQVWRGKSRENALREQLLTDPHSPTQYRVGGVVPNIDAWYKAFDITPDSAMYIPPEKRVKIW
ncbi:M13 family metallopeptidase [uncultured Parasphingorhabdus sp.]|uniref:M13 family metallopeptidase n=1 Tax=uncultured Parasphingorhabdus sp. TaxID=2709694 RepID=UPI0030DBFE19